MLVLITTIIFGIVVVAIITAAPLWYDRVVRQDSSIAKSRTSR